MKKIVLLLSLLILGSPFKILCQWKKIQLPINSYITGFAMDVTNKNTCLLVYNGNPKPGLLLTKDGGQSFVTFNNFLYNTETLSDVAIVDSLNFWVVTSRRILFTSDSGNNWTTQFNDTSQTTFINYIKMFDLNNGIVMGDPKNSSTRTVILRTSNGGKDWINVNETMIGFSSGDTWRRIDFPSSQVGYFYESGVNPQKIYKTINGGKNWEAVTTPTGIMALKFYDTNIGSVIGQNINGIFINTTMDGGKTWPYLKTISTSGWGNDIEFIPNNPAKIIATNMSNVYCSIDTGKTWKTVLLPAGTVRIRDIEFADEKTGWILCDNGLLYKTENADYLTTGNEAEKNLPSDFILNQNYPNPFNPETTINYKVSTGSFVTLKVFDMLGREVATLVNEFKQPGSFNSKFTILNSQLPSGIYFYQMKTNGFVQTKKMVLMK